MQAFSMPPTKPCKWDTDWRKPRLVVRATGKKGWTSQQGRFGLTARTQCCIKTVALVSALDRTIWLALSLSISASRACFL